MQLPYSQTSRFALNSSTSKHQYPFPKAKRFPSENRSHPKAKFYTLPSEISYHERTAPSFPKLKRQLQFPNSKQKTIVPSPSTYSIKSDIEKSLTSKKGISIPKEKLKLKKKSITPSPFHYNPKRQPFLSARYSIGKSQKKLQFPIDLQKGSDSPGPSYLVNVSKLQKVVGKYVHQKCMKVYSEPSLKTSPREQSVNVQKKYFSKLSLNSKTSQLSKNIGLQTKIKATQSMSLLKSSANKKFPSLLLANKKQSVLGKFGKAERKSIFEKKSQIPGPMYNRFSQFSRLEKKIYQDRQKGKNLKKKLKNQTNIQTQNLIKNK